MAVITEDWSLDAWICISALALGLYFYVTRNHNYWEKRGVKAVRPWFFFGNIAPCLFATKTPDALIQEIYNKGEGEQFIGFHCFNTPYLLVRDPELIKNVFIKDFSNFSNKLLCGKHADVMTSMNLFLASNPPWKHIRMKLSPFFTSGKLKKMYELMVEISDELQVYLDKLDIDEKVGKPVEIKEICAKFTTDIIGVIAYGMHFNSLKDPEAAFRKYGREMFRSTYRRYLQLLAVVFIPHLRPYTNAKFFDEKATDFLRQAFWYAINERIKTGIKRHDLIDMLIEIKNNQENGIDDTYKLEGDALVAQAAVFFTGGFETSSTAMSFALYELARNPEAQTKLRNELLNALETTGGKVTYDMLTTLPYLNMVMLEALRLYPVISWLDRMPDEDYTFPGTNITVEKGVPLILPMRALQLDPKYFPNPDKFIPERFSEENKKNIVPFSYFPFGDGPRGCIGIRLGHIQTKLGIVNFVSKYELTTSMNNLQPDGLNVLTHAKGGIHLNLRKLSA